MSESSPDPSVAHFGPDGMRHFAVTGAYRTHLPENALRALESHGVPLHVAPYFTAAEPTDGLTLGLFAANHGVERTSQEGEFWLRLGSDGPVQLCLTSSGTVHGVSLGIHVPDMFVSSHLASFTASLAALDRRMPVIAASTSLPVAAAAFRELNAELRQIDTAAFQDQENWWPRVLDDVRHTLNFPFSSAFEYVDAAGETQIATAMTGPGKAHPEERVWARLEAEGIEPEHVQRVYCELEPCMMPGHYCAAWMHALFPNAEFTHSFEYGTLAESRERGIKELITYAAREAEGTR